MITDHITCRSIFYDSIFGGKLHYWTKIIIYGVPRPPTIILSYLISHTISHTSGVRSSYSYITKRISRWIDAGCLVLVTCHLFYRVPDGYCISFYHNFKRYFFPVQAPPVSSLQIQNDISVPPVTPVKISLFAADSCQHKHKRS